MHCLRWWLPIFLLPLPAASPMLTLLFVAAYAVRTKPCAYCSVIILGLMMSTCAFYSYVPIASIRSPATPSPKTDATKGDAQTLLSGMDVRLHYDQARGAEEQKAQSKASTSPASACWIDLTGPFTSSASVAAEHGEDSRAAADEQTHEDENVDMGWWTAPTRRKLPTVLRTWSAKQKERQLEQVQLDSTNISPLSTKWWSQTLRRAWRDGVYIGFGDEAGFRVKLLVD